MSVFESKDSRNTINYSLPVRWSPPLSSQHVAYTAAKYYTVQVGFTTFRIDERYQNLKPQGAGAYGCVVSAFDKHTNLRVAIKKIKDPFSNLLDAKQILREIKLLRHLKSHENIVCIYDIMIDPPNTSDFEDIYIVTNLFDSDLERIIQSNQKLTDQHCQYFMYQSLRALKYVHSANILHRDIKPSNLLVNANCDLALCDFGLGRAAAINHNIKSSSSSSLFSSADPMTEYVVTRWYRAPELLCESSVYGKAVDIWSLGCIFAELITHTPFFRGDSPHQQLQAIIHKLGCPPKEKLTFIQSKAALMTILKHSSHSHHQHHHHSHHHHHDNKAYNTHNSNNIMNNNYNNRNNHNDSKVHNNHSPQLSPSSSSSSSDMHHFACHFPRGTSFLALDLIRRMIEFCPEDRITVEEALSHPYIKDFHNQVAEPSCHHTFDFNFDPFLIPATIITTTTSTSSTIVSANSSYSSPSSSSSSMPSIISPFTCRTPVREAASRHLIQPPQPPLVHQEQLHQQQRQCHSNSDGSISSISHMRNILNRTFFGTESDTADNNKSTTTASNITTTGNTNTSATAGGGNMVSAGNNVNTGNNVNVGTASEESMKCKHSGSQNNDHIYSNNNNNTNNGKCTTPSSLPVIPEMNEEDDDDDDDDNDTVKWNDKSICYSTEQDVDSDCQHKPSVHKLTNDEHTVLKQQPQQQQQQYQQHHQQLQQQQQPQPREDRVNMKESNDTVTTFDSTSTSCTPVHDHTAAAVTVAATSPSTAATVSATTVAVAYDDDDGYSYKKAISDSADAIIIHNNNNHNNNNDNDNVMIRSKASVTISQASLTPQQRQEEQYKIMKRKARDLVLEEVALYRNIHPSITSSSSSSSSSSAYGYCSALGQSPIMKNSSSSSSGSMNTNIKNNKTTFSSSSSSSHHHQQQQRKSVNNTTVSSAPFASTSSSNYFLFEHDIKSNHNNNNSHGHTSSTSVYNKSNENEKYL